MARRKRKKPVDPVRSEAAKRGWRTRCARVNAIEPARPLQLFAANKPEIPVKRVISSGLPNISIDWRAAGWLGLAVSLGYILYSRVAEAKKIPPLPNAPKPTPIVSAPLTIEDEEIIKNATSEPVEPSGTPAVELATNYRRLKANEVTPALGAIAQDSLKFPLGHIEFFQSGGKNYAASLEEHFHEPGGPLTPWGKHKGVSLFIKK